MIILATLAIAFSNVIGYLYGYRQGSALARTSWRGTE